MIPLAQIEPTTPLQIPVSYGGIAAIVFGGIVVLVLVALWMLQEFQKGRAAFVAEVKRELSATPEPQAMTLPQPFTVQPHTEFVQKPDFDKAIREAHGRMNRERDDATARIAAVAASAAAVREHLDAELVAIREQLAGNNQAGEERATKLHDRINAMLESTSELRGEVRQALASRK